MALEDSVKNFYDNYWPKNIPDYSKTEHHIFNLLPEGEFFLSLDAGCGMGACSFALSKKINRVVSCDLSPQSLKTANLLSKKIGIKNINFINGNLLSLPFKNNTFDLVLSWGAIHHTLEPRRSFQEITRVLKENGWLIVAVYQKTKLTFLHELLRSLCLSIKSKLFKYLFLKIITYLVRILEICGKRQKVRDDNVKIESLAEDWFFVPVKHFFSIDDLRYLFQENNLTFEILYQQAGRLRSSSNIILRGRKER